MFVLWGLASEEKLPMAHGQALTLGLYFFQNFLHLITFLTVIVVTVV